MKIVLSSDTLRRFFKIASACIVVILFIVFGYLYVRFYELLIGNVQLETPPNLLMQLETRKLDQALKRSEKRLNLPYFDAQLKNPFKS